MKQCFNGLASMALTDSQTLLNSANRISDAEDVETVNYQLRVVWLTGLPPRFALRDLGASLDHGATMSILLQNDVSPELPGRSACIIFRDASNAAFFVFDNAMVASGNGRAIKDEQSFDNVPSSASAGLFADIAPESTVFLGAPYPLDADLLSMDPPESARRRLKWTRSRMFYDVSLAQFKQDVISICGLENVELFQVSANEKPLWVFGNSADSVRLVVSDSRSLAFRVPKCFEKGHMRSFFPLQWAFVEQ